MVDLVASGIMFPYMYVETVSQAVPVAMSWVVQRHTRIRLKECPPWGQVIDWH